MEDRTFGELLSGIEGGDSLAQKFGRDTLEDSIAALAKSYKEAESRMHTTEKPPETADGYKAPKEMPTSVVSRARDIAHEAAMTQSQFEHLAARLGGEMAELAQKARGAKEGIQKSYGDEYGTAKARALRAAETLRAQGTEVGDIEGNPALFQALERYGATMADDNSPLDTTPPDSGKVSELDVKQAAAKARAIMESGRMSRNSPDYGVAYREYEECMATVMGAGFDSAFDARLLDPFDPYRRAMGLDD